jgi:hypothetical protein
MKKLTIFVLILINSFLLTGCDNYYKLSKSNIAEIRHNIFVGSSDNFDITFMSGKREKDYVINGYNTELIDFGIVTITLTNTDINVETPSFALTIETLRYEEVLEKNPFDGTYVADIGVVVNNDLPNISIKIFMGDIVEEATLTNISKSWELDSYGALKLACKSLKEELKPLIQNEFQGEVYIKIIKDTIVDDGSYYWYINFAGRNGVYHNIIINPLTSVILAKK